ncbi:melanoma-associated antigen 10 [Heterocephalus glaber]|uniref:Melanoma-associated antigen 10 n=2 Tax=Heterocephalus glaber TaxID=10181 RepID=A0AAX6S6P2_HETGA|nr:melanoma-associated antigen 10 [Heterocephalus glaber]XP_021104850.1 melanoma-associated antigen 10 [Heterocephalus glaber]
MSVPVLKDVEEEAAATASSACSTSYSIISPTPKQELELWILSYLQSCEGILSPPTAMASTPGSHFSESSNTQKAEGSSPSQATNFPQILCSVLLNEKLRNLVPFLVRKYQKKEQTTMEEMLHIVSHDYCEHFLLNYKKFCESLSLGLGIEIRLVDPSEYIYDLVPILGLTYNGILDDDEQIIPKVDLLIYILSVIFINGNSVSVEELRKQVRSWEILVLRERVVIGDPWKFITEDLVREQYLMYRQVLNSGPASYEFLWGPRAHTETTQMKVLEHVAKLNNTDPRSYPHLYEWALREENTIVRVPERQDV